MKMVFRGDDVGYTVTHNAGTWRAIEDGVLTHCDLMLDCPGFEDACEYLKDKPWISIGWHTHFWGRPVLDPKEVPSMVNAEGKFKWRKQKNLINEVDYDEALRECRAQLDRCVRMLGRAPDVMGNRRRSDPVADAIRQACREYGITQNFMSEWGEDGQGVEAQYAALHIVHRGTKDSELTRSLREADYDTYDPAGSILSIPVSDDKIVVNVLHPGYLDDYVLSESSCTIPRVKDVAAYCDPRVKEWIRSNNIELINLTDALNGTSLYQNHLKAIGSDLVKK